MSPLLDSEKSIEKKVEHSQPAVVESKNLIKNFLLNCTFVYISLIYRKRN